MKVYGLTGGIASGKSSIARQFRALGVTVVDADELARLVVEPGQPAYGEIRQRWPQVIGKDGAIDRKALGDIVFADAPQRAELNAMVHPRVAEESARRISDADERGQPMAMYEAALLVENGMADAFDGLIVVSVPEDVQVARLRARDRIAEAPARARIAAQLPLGRKVERATWVIDNGGTAEETAKQVNRLFAQLRGQGSVQPSA